MIEVVEARPETWLPPLPPRTGVRGRIRGTPRIEPGICRTSPMRHKVKHIHFVGIGGAGMSGIAEVLANQGYLVTGSDLAQNAATDRLARLGARIVVGHAPHNVAGADVVVVSTAVKSDNPEVIAARARRVPVVPRALMLAELMRLKRGIAIAGTHGKTTTTSLVASVLAEGGLDPTFVIGGRLTSAASNARLGAGDFIVAEADESDASFLHLQPVMAVVTNIDADHMETYQHDFARLRQAFVDFLQHLPFYGDAILCIDDSHVREIIPFVSKPIVTYGFAREAMVRAEEVVADGGGMRFRCRREGSPDLAELRLNLPGHHNVQNALAAIAIATELDVPDTAIAKALAEFRGVGRRFQRHGEVSLPAGGSFTLVDDYGHHPVEMQATLAAARGAFPDRRIVLAFQPHRFTRTRDLFEDFVKVLSSVDALLLAEVYAAGESPIVAADGRALARAIRVAGKVEPVFVEAIGDMPQAIMDLARDGDVVITMGAGSVGGVPARLVETGAGAQA
jgi:UDP-N-acetylmuramate--alanine ligase